MIKKYRTFNENIHSDLDPFDEETWGKEDLMPAENLEIGDDVTYIGWNGDYFGKNGVVIKVGRTEPDLPNHALVLFDIGYAWWPFVQLSLRKD